MDQSPLRIVLASDFTPWLKEVHAQLETVPGVQVVRDVSHGAETLVTCHKERPDIVLLDLSQPPQHISPLLTNVHHVAPETHIVGYTPFYRDEVATLVANSRIASYVTEAELNGSLRHILAMVMTGLVWVSTLD